MARSFKHVRSTLGSGAVSLTMRRINAQMPALYFLSLAICLLALGTQVVKGQEAPVGQQPSAPPPVKLITKEDGERIAVAKDDKARLRTTIELSEVYLVEAETRSEAAEFEAASTSLGKYHALIEDALAFLSKLKPDQNRTRDLYKRLELALRAHGPRLTSIRRATPLEYAVWIKKIEEFARQGRTEALNSFYGNTVLKEPHSKAETDKQPKTAKESPSSPNN